MVALVSVSSEDNQYRYRITAQATSSTTASMTETKVDKNTQVTTNATYEITDVVVVNDVLKGTVHLPALQTESISLERGPANMVTIKTGGFFFGLGAQTLGPFALNAADYEAIGDWEIENFAHN